MAALSDSRAVELDLRDPRWIAFMAEHPGGLAFHRPEWAEALTACYGYRSFVLACLDERGGIAGALPVCEVRRLARRRWVTLPFTDACPPLLRRDFDADQFARALRIAGESAGVDSFAVRSDLPETTHVRTHAAAVTHTLDLSPNTDQLYDGFHRSQVQRNIRRAEREEIVIRRAETRQEVTHTYYALQAQTRRRLGAPVQPRRFFAAVWERLLEPGLGHVLLAYSGSEAVAGAVFLNGTETITYKYGASDSNFWRLRPNHLLFWNAIRSAAEEGFRRFDFGRSDFEDEGLRNFKSGWGAVEQPLVYTTISERPRATGSTSSPPVARAILRRAPTWFCRAAGEVLYRYAA